MAKKKNKSKPTIDIDVEVDNQSGPPADPNVPDLPTPKIAVHVSNANNNHNSNHNANANANGNGNANLNGGVDRSVHLHHDHNHHHSHYARSVGQDSKGGEKVTETKEVVDGDEDEGTTTKTKTVKETTNTVAGGGTIKVHSSKAPSTHHPSSPVGSVKSLSHKNARPPDIVVNIALPPAAAPAPAPAVAITPPTPIPRPPSIAPAAIPLPASVPPSPTISVRSLAPSRSMHTKPPRTVFAVPIKEDDEEEIEETTVVTTTRKIKRSPSRTPPPPLPLPPSYAPPGTPLVVSDPTWKPVPEPRSMVSRPASIRDKEDGYVETTTVKTVTHSPKQKEKSSFLDKLVPKCLKPTNTGPPPAENQTIQVRVHPGGEVDVDVGTGAATAGNATTVGGDGARTVNLGKVPSEPSGRKAGIRPIPIIDYKALITQSPPRRHRPPPPTTAHHSPAAPKTILTMSADLVPDSHGNPHYHARVRDHTGVHKHDKTTGAKTAKTHHGGAGGLDVHADGVDVHIDKKGDVDIEIDEVETKRERKDRDRRERHERRELLREPLYKPLKGAYPAPMSERYAMPPPLEDIQNAARERYERRAGFPPQMGYGMGGMGAMPGMSRMGGMGMGGMPGMPGMGMGMGPPYPPPGPMTMPRPPPFMGQRPPMFAGNFPPYPTSGMGIPMNNSVMGMGMGQMGYGQGMPGWQGQGYGWQGNPRFPGRSGM